MGKYMRKTKTTDEVAVMESPLGVRTRARTLALQQQQPSSSSSSCYLQLRSRRLEKPPPPPPTKLGPTSSVCPTVSEVEVSFGENFLELESRERNSRETTPCSMIRDSETIRTPSSTTRANSTTINFRRQDSACRNIPTASEMEEFFAHAEQIQQRIFVEKYNFDPVSECPLAGRYEWVKLGC